MDVVRPAEPAIDGHRAERRFSRRRPPFGGKVVPFDASGYSVVAGSPPLNWFITPAIPPVTNISAASAARSDHALDLLALIRVEPRQHVIGQVPLRPPTRSFRPASDAQPQPRKLVADVRDDRLQPVVPAGRSSRPCPQLAERQLRPRRRRPARSADLDLEVPQQPADRLAAGVHERHAASPAGRRLRPAAPSGDQRVRPEPNSKLTAARSPARPAPRTRRCAACPGTSAPDSRAQ